MIKLKSLLESETTDSDQWDDWIEYLHYFDYDIEKSEIKKLIDKFQLQWKNYFNGTVLSLSTETETRYLTYDEKNNTYEPITDIDQWFYKLDASELGIDPDTLYNGHVESSLKDFKKNPGTVYHYTTEDGWEEIQSDKQIIGSSGTGINNRSAYGIFTSVDPEEYATGTYGDVCLEINLNQFKIDSGLLELNLTFEPEVEEYLLQEYVSHTLNLQMEPNISSDISPYTVVVNHNIPLKYINQI
jgi:hypothetical protein